VDDAQLVTALEARAAEHDSELVIEMLESGAIRAALRHLGGAV
jgi:hypothetical protein